MSKIRVRSYLDGNAPQFLCADKNGIIPFIKAMFEQESYGNVTPTAYEQDLVNNQLILTFEAPPGFSAGNLIQIVGSSKNSINQNYFRVVATDGLRLYLKYDYSKLEDLTSGFIPSALVVRHAPLNWEVAYSSDSQISIRSKNTTSTKNVFTFKRPSSAEYTAEKWLYLSTINISRDVSNTGELVESFLQSTQNDFAGATESPWCIHTYNWYYNWSEPVLTQKYPWYLISDDKFFYLILGHNPYDGAQRNGINFDRTNAFMSRSMFVFGDPDPILESDVDPLKTIFSGFYANPSSYNKYVQGSTNYSQPFVTVNSNDTNNSYAGTFLSIRDFNNLPGKPGKVTPTSFSFANTYSFPSPLGHGIMFQPLYFSKILGTGINSGNYIRSKMPFAVQPLQSLRNLVSASWASIDYVPIKANGSLILNIVLYADPTVQNTFSFELD